MKKFFNKFTIFGFCIGILTCSVCVYAYAIKAADVSFSSNKSGFTDSDVKSALDTLYDRSTNLFNRIDGSYSYTNYHNPDVSTSSTTLNLTKGNYYSFITFNYAINCIENYSFEKKIQYTYWNSLLTYDNTSCDYIDGYETWQSSDSVFHDNRATIQSFNAILKCSVTGENGSVKLKGGLSTDKRALTMSINSIKVD